MCLRVAACALSAESSRAARATAMRGCCGAITALIEGGRLSLDGLITHRVPANQAQDAYRTAFADPSCLKMILDWRNAA